MFRSYSDHLQEARMFLAKVTDFKTRKTWAPWRWSE